jgi:hypothetical protein
MKEDDLSEALHDVMVRVTPPPSMDPASALDRGRRARKRRTAVLTGAAAVTLAVGVGAGTALVAHYAGPGDAMVAGGLGGTPSASPSQPVSTVTPTAPPATRKTGDPWPEGQTDRTATTGPRATRAVTLMNDLSSSVPAGFTAPDLKYPDGRAMRWPQAQYASNDGEQDYWEYQAIIPVQKDNRVGSLLVQSTTPSGKAALSPCKLAQQFWGGTGSCAVLNVGGKQVGVVTDNGRGRYDQWAAYRYDDGTVVFLAQAKKVDDSGRSPLKQPVFTPGQLAELVTSPKFKISA